MHYEEPKVDQHYAICFRHLLPSADLYAAQNVTNGLGRPVALPNCWKAPLAEAPSLTLEFDTPVDAEEIQILFNGQIENDHFSTVVEMLVRDYTLTLTDASGTRDIEVSGNYLAFSRHTGAFIGLKSVKITPHATYASPYAEIYSVKVF